MKYRHELIGKKVLIICNSIGTNYRKSYCSYVLGRITEYNPITNKICVIRDTNHIGSSVEFELNNHDPFDFPFYKDNRFATKNPTDYNETWWYIILSDEYAINLLKNNIKHINLRKPDYKSYYLSSVCYGKYKSKKEYLTYLLNELNNEV